MLEPRIVLLVTLAVLTLFTWLGIRHTRGRIRSADDYLSARNTTRIGATTATLVASVMGGWILFSPAEAGADFGLTAVIGYGLGSMTAMLVYVFLAPRIRDLVPEGHTLSEYAHARYGSLMAGFVLLVSVFYMFLFLATNMTAITGALALLAGIPIWATAILVGAFVLLYTAYGGLKASIFTDKIQLLLLLPLLVIGYGAALHWLGGTGAIHSATMNTNPQLLSMGFLPGILFGISLVIAILGAELLNQAWWQRTYAAENKRTLRPAFLLAGLIVFPMVVLGGLFGVAAAGLGLVPEGGSSVALFHLLLAAMPDWIVLTIVLLALLLVMSTSDTLLSAIASIITTDLPRHDPHITNAKLTRIARSVTIIAALGAIWIAAQGWSVLAIFFTADLFAVATAFPLLFGLWNRRAPEWGVLLAAVVGMIVGLSYFPVIATPLPMLPLLFSEGFVVELLHAFAGAALVSVLVTVLSSRFGKPLDLSTLTDRTWTLNEPAPVPEEDEP